MPVAVKTAFCQVVFEWYEESGGDMLGMLEAPRDRWR